MRGGAFRYRRADGQTQTPTSGNASDIDVDKLARFIKRAKYDSKSKLNLSFDEIKGILNQYFMQDDIKYVTASINNNLLGFLVIYPASVESKEINLKGGKTFGIR